MIKKIILHLLKIKPLTKFLLFCMLKLHSFAYRATSILAPNLETDCQHPKFKIIRYHEWFIKRMEKNWNVLDIGCGTGELAHGLKSVARSVTGIDIELYKIEFAKKHFVSDQLVYVCSNALDFQIDENIDAIILSNVLEHIEDRVSFLKRLFDQEINKDRKLLLRVPMITRDWISVYKKEKGVTWKLDNTHFTEYTIEQLFDEMDKADLKIIDYEIQFGEFYGVIERND